MLTLRLKYDLKALFRVTWPLYVAIIVMSFGIYVYEMIQNWAIFHIPLFDMFVGIYSFVYVIALMGLIIWPIIVCIRDFFNTMLKDEGYLTNTLPVSRNILILSKELAGLIFFLISCILLIISLFAVVMPSISLMDIGRVFGDSAELYFICDVDDHGACVGIFFYYIICLSHDAWTDASFCQRNF